MESLFLSKKRIGSGCVLNGHAYYIYRSSESMKHYILSDDPDFNGDKPSLFYELDTILM